jgi:methionyl-tRNA synthetase
LSPVLPRLKAQTEALLNTPITHWNDSQQPLAGTPVAPFQALLSRVDPAKVKQMVDDSKETLSTTDAAKAAGQAIKKALGEVAEPVKTLASSVAHKAGELFNEAVQNVKELVKPANDADAIVVAYADGPEPLAAEPLAATCTIDDFAKIDLRVARIIRAEEVPEAKKLLKLTVSLGGDQTRTVFAGIKAAYKPEDLVGRLVIVVANLLPRQMKFGLSEGMVAAAGAGGAEVFLLSPDSGAKPGHRVH